MNKKAALMSQDPAAAKEPTLRDRVARLAAPVKVLRSGYRSVPVDKGADLLGLILREIDETIQPRGITLVTDTGRSLVLHVVDRRLVHISPPGKGGAVAPDAENPTPSHLINQLQHVLDGAARIALHSKHNQNEALSAERGYRAADLAASALVEFSPVDPVWDLFDQLGSCSLARVTLDPSDWILARDGDEDWIARLSEFTQNGLADIDAQLVQTLASPDQPGCIYLDAGNESTLALVYARAPEGGFLAVIPSTQLATVQASFPT